MEKFSQKWGVISLLEDVDEGSEFYYTDFPLHVTLAGVFAIDRAGSELTDGLTDLLATQRAVDIWADEKAMFGPKEDVAVMKVKQTADLMDLYGLIHQWLLRQGAIFNTPQYEGEGYSPHSTFQKTDVLDSGETRQLRSISLIDLFPNGDGLQRKIVKTIQLL